MRYGKAKKITERRLTMSEQKKKKFDNKKFVRYAEGAEMYSMGLSKFQ